MTSTLESPSRSICHALPVKQHTSSFGTNFAEYTGSHGPVEAPSASALSVEVFSKSPSASPPQMSQLSLEENVLCSEERTRIEAAIRSLPAVSSSSTASSGENLHLSAEEKWCPVTDFPRLTSETTALYPEATDSPAVTLYLDSPSPSTSVAGRTPVNSTCWARDNHASTQYQNTTCDTSQTPIRGAGVPSFSFYGCATRILF